MLPFGEYKPDLSNFNGQTTQLALNVVPRADGYGPWKALTPVTASLPAPSRGTFYARKTDGTIVVFAGTSTRLYKLDNTTLAWTDVSKGAVAYSALPSTDHWGFAQFGNLVIAVQANTVPQVFDISSGSAFADLGGAPPQARYAAVVGRFLVLSGLLSTPYRIQWSGLNAITTWTPGVNSSDFQDFPDGGVVRGVAGGEFGVIFQDSVIRRMVYAVGASYVFKIDRIAEDKGLLAPYSLIRAGDKIFFLANQGFHGMLATGVPEPIGKEKFDRTFFGDYDPAQLQQIIGASDPENSRVFWAYKSKAGQAGLFDKLICYDYVLNRAAVISQTGEFLTTFDIDPPLGLVEATDQLAFGMGTTDLVPQNGFYLRVGRSRVTTPHRPSLASYIQDLVRHRHTVDLACIRHTGRNYMARFGFVERHAVRNVPTDNPSTINNTAKPWKCLCD